MNDLTTEERLDRLEKLTERVLELARQHPIGRKILAALGVDDA